MFDPEMTDALFLGLRLDPQVSEDLLPVGLDTRRRPSESFRSCQMKSVLGGGTIATIPQTFIPDVTNVTPALLVVTNVNSN